MKKTLDAKGLACPQPVINTKNAIEEGGYSELEIIVDNEAAKENVSRYIRKQNIEIKEVIEKDSSFHILISGDQEEKKEIDLNEEDYTCPVPEYKGKTLFIGNNKIGHGDDTLGEKLMNAFIFTLNELKTPATMLFMNSGVKLCVEGSDALENLQKLESKGVEILVCGTCLNFFEISEKLKVGKISNMYDIAGKMIDDLGVVTIG